MSSRLPTPADFPFSLTISIVPPRTGQPVNILLLLHGLGDTNAPFTALGRQLNLPETAAISIQGPSPIPAIFTGDEKPAFHWGDDVLVDERTGDVDMDAGFTTSRKLLHGLVYGVLIEKCRYALGNVFFYAFGQGGMAALDFSSSLPPPNELGGVVSIGGRLPRTSKSRHLDENAGKFATPLLVLGGSRSTEVTRSAVDALKEAFADVEYVRWAKAEDSMPKSREEMLPIMKFLAKRLKSRAGVPEGAVELGQGGR